MTLADEQIAGILQTVPEASLAEVVAAPIQAVEETLIRTISLYWDTPR